jgi:hypothetical protein
MDKVSDAFKGVVNASSFFAGIVTALYLVIIGYGYADNFTWLKEWQTLLSGIFAILAAVATFWAIRLQISQVDEHANDNRQRRNLAARAALSQPLSNIIVVQQTIISGLSASLESSQSQTVPYTSGQFAIADESDISKLIDCIVDAELQPADDISKLVSQLQVQSARLSSETRRRGSTRRNTEIRATVEHYLVDALFVHARAEGLILYARRQDREYEERVFEKAVQTATFLNHVDDLDASFSSTLQRRIQRERS